MDKYRVTLTAEERIGLEQLVSTGKAAARKLTHARILLLADTHAENCCDEEITHTLASRQGNGSANPEGLCSLRARTGGGVLPRGQEDPAGAGQSQHPRRGQPI